MFTLLFWKQTAERAVKTAGQTGVLALGTVVFTNVEQVISAASLVGLGMLFGAVLSVLTSLASINIGDSGTPSLVSAEPTPKDDEVFAAGEPDTGEDDH
jgi:hypothetical protein